MNVTVDTSNASLSHKSIPKHADGLPTPQRYWAIAGLLVIIMISVIESNISNIALPTIAADLTIAPANIIWVTNIYLIAIIICLLPFSSLADRIGYRRIYRLGVGIFMLGAIGSMLSTSLPSLLFFRAIQGVGAACFMAIFGGLVRHIYPRTKLALGVSINAMTVGFSALIAPSLGAFIISISSWHWIYGFTIPFCLLALLLSLFLPRIDRLNKPFDWLSALLNALSLGGFVCALDLFLSHSLISALLLLTALISAYFLYQRSIKQELPMVPVDLFKINVFRYAVFVSALCFGSATMVMISIPFYFERELFMPPHIVGLLFSAWPIATLCVAPIAAQLSNRYPASILAGTGNVIMLIGITILLALAPQAHPLWFALGLFTTGTGFGFFQTPNNKAILLSTPLDRSSATGGLQSCARLFGQCCGAAFAALLFTLLGTDGYHNGIMMGGVIACAAAALNLIRYLNKSDVAVI